MSDSIGVAVIGAGMAGKAHAAAYRSATTVFDPALPPVRLVSIGDVNAEFGRWPPAASATSATTRPGRRSPRPTTSTWSAW